ncbi:hypothetical protein WN943_013880 [Citrus x changshan-huyou]
MAASGADCSRWCRTITAASFMLQQLLASVTGRGLDDGDVCDVCSNCGVASFNDGEASTTARLVVCSDSNVLRRGWEEDGDRSTALQPFKFRISDFPEAST